MGNNEFKLSDTVLMRIVQIVQEALFTGTDCVDLMREIKVVSDPSDPSSLVMTEAYQELVKRSHEQLLTRAAELQSELAPRGTFSDD